MLNFLAIWMTFGAPEAPRRAEPVAVAVVDDDKAQAPADERIEAAYDRGQDDLDQEHFDEAIKDFDEVIQSKGPRADGAVYWKANAQCRKGARPDCLATLAVLYRDYPKSRWVKDGKALEAEVKGGTTQDRGDEETMLVALNALMQTDPERAIPVLEKLLAGSPGRLKDRALFVLSQNPSPKALEILERIATDGKDPDLQKKALRDLTLYGVPKAKDILERVYSSGASEAVRKSILQDFMLSGERTRLLALAKTEASPELRKMAIQQLGLMGAQQELWEMYRSEGDPAPKKAIIEALFLSGNSEKMAELARTEKDLELRKTAVRDLGLMGASDLLASLYATEKDFEIRRAIIEGLFLSGNAKALVQIGRAEKDPELRKQLVSRLGLMGSKDGTDFLLEILNK